MVKAKESKGSKKWRHALWKQLGPVGKQGARVGAVRVGERGRGAVWVLVRPQCSSTNHACLTCSGSTSACACSPCPSTCPH